MTKSLGIYSGYLGLYQTRKKPGFFRRLWLNRSRLFNMIGTCKEKQWRKPLFPIISGADEKSCPTGQRALEGAQIAWQARVKDDFKCPEA